MAVTIRDFTPGDEAAFRRLNEEWIVRYFAMESKDEEVFRDPWSDIILNGGRIFLAEDERGAVGCCALLAIGPGEFELGKMAVIESRQGQGIGRLILAHAVAEARRMNARRVYLESNRILGPAIQLYESAGFRHVSPPAQSPYSRTNVFMELIL